MKKKIIKDGLEFLVLFFILTVIVDFFREKILDTHYFLSLLAESVIASVLFALLLSVFKKKYQKDD